MTSPVKIFDVTGSHLLPWTAASLSVGAGTFGLHDIFKTCHLIKQSIPVWCMQDPLADGPTIHAAATRALLEQHVTLDQVLPAAHDQLLHLVLLCCMPPCTCFFDLSTSVLSAAVFSDTVYCLLMHL